MAIPFISLYLALLNNLCYQYYQELTINKTLISFYKVQNLSKVYDSLSSLKWSVHNYFCLKIPVLLGYIWSHKHCNQFLSSKKTSGDIHIARDNLFTIFVIYQGNKFTSGPQNWMKFAIIRSFYTFFPLFYSLKVYIVYLNLVSPNLFSFFNFSSNWCQLPARLKNFGDFSFFLHSYLITVLLLWKQQGLLSLV